jgi:hypothetical protein
MVHPLRIKADLAVNPAPVATPFIGKASKKPERSLSHIIPEISVLFLKSIKI